MKRYLLGESLTANEIKILNEYEDFHNKKQKVIRALKVLKNTLEALKLKDGANIAQQMIDDL